MNHTKKYSRDLQRRGNDPPLYFTQRFLSLVKGSKYFKVQTLTSEKNVFSPNVRPLFHLTEVWELRPSLPCDAQQRAEGQPAGTGSTTTRRSVCDSHYHFLKTFFCSFVSRKFRFFWKNPFKIGNFSRKSKKTIEIFWKILLKNYNEENKTKTKK